MPSVQAKLEAQSSRDESHSVKSFALVPDIKSQEKLEIRRDRELD